MSSFASKHPLVSIIIPTFNEELSLPFVLESIPRSKKLEVLVVDGGSVDGTLKVAVRDGRPIIVHSKKRGRGIQMDLGAKKASGQIFFFLHADCIPDTGHLFHLKKALKRKNLAGYFDFYLTNRGFKYRILELLTNFRARFFRLPYGDQGLFLHRQLYQQLNGFKPYPFLEDVDFIFRLKSRKVKLLRFPVKMKVSTRTWEKKGILYCSFRNILLVILFVLGFHPETLKKFYVN
ncbi:TIGR04283 family arsenosugar biosynthesis glycosyltransferase [Candidatus Riflebacteria bacterium]